MGVLRSKPEPVMPAPATRVVRPLLFVGDDDALVSALRAGHPGAKVALFDRYGSHVRRVLVSTLELDPELPDLLHDVFLAAFESIHQLSKAGSLKAWLTSVAVFVARGRIRRRRRRWWLKFRPPEALPDLPVSDVSPEASQAVRATYAILEQLPVDERLAFSLRLIEGMELTEVAAACRVSLATAKRRLARALRKFAELAKNQPALEPWLKESRRWSV
ncbi:MAG TPA: sigma-70 family RNA polymerase sigma factor [Polyangiaceae bacterium]